MPHVVYVGTSHFREIDANAWKSVGVTDQNKTVWDREASNSVEVSDAAWDFLKRTEKDDFKEVPAPQPSGETEAPTNTGNPASTRKIKDNPQA